MKPLERIQMLDTSLVERLFTAKSHQSLLPASHRISATGDGLLYVLCAFSCGLYFGFGHWFFMLLLQAFVIERSCYFVLKNVLKRNRPFRTMTIKNQVNPSDQFSFPSGHTSAAFLFAVIVSHAVPVLLLPLIFWASLVGLSRVVLGVHYPTDILAGAAMGSCIALANLPVN